MPLNLWSDEDRLFIPRLGGWTINFKYIARKLGWIKRADPSTDLEEPGDTARDSLSETPEERLKKAVDRSRYEDDASSRS